MFREKNLSMEQPEQRERKKFNIDVGFFYGCNSIQEIPELLEEALKEGSLDTAMFNEFTFTVKEVLNNKESIVSLAKEKRVSLIMASSNGNKLDSVQWIEMQEELKQAGIVFEEGDIPDDYKPEAIGFYFNKNGAVYAFPKSFEKHPVHKIPDTNIGITICGEMRNIKSSDLKGIDILYNPSLEGDDPFHKERLEFLAEYQEKGEVTRETVEKLVLKKKKFKNLLLPDHEYCARFKDVPEELIETEEERKKKLNQHIDYFWEPIKNNPETAFDSTYMKDMKEIRDILKQEGIPILRCDRSSTSGLLNPSCGSKMDNANFKEKFGRTHIS